MATPRERTMIDTRTGGTCGRFTWWPEVSPGVAVPFRLNFARDNVGPEDDYPIDFDYQEYVGGTVNQKFGGYYSSWFNNWVPEILRSGFNLSHLRTGTSLLDAYYATQAAARTNPSRPYVDIPREIAEIRDLPTLLRRGFGNPGFLPSLDRSTPGQFGSGYLGYQFGIRPIADTIAKMATAHQQVTRRVEEVKRLVATGIKRTLNVDVSTAQSDEYRYIDTAHSTMGGNFHTWTVEGVRAHVRWGLYPSAIPDNMSNSERNALITRWATDAVWGRTIDTSTLYDLTPWSWLLDWFSSLGDYIHASRNIVPALLKEVVVMRHFKTVSSYPGETYDPGGGAQMISIAPIRMTRESKTRRFSFISPLPVHLPFLEKGQVQILASLAAART